MTGSSRTTAATAASPAPTPSATARPSASPPARTRTAPSRSEGADPATGKKSWSYRLPKGFKVKSVYSVDPIVLDLGDEAGKERSIVVLGPDGKPRTTVSGEGSFPVNCGKRDHTLQGCTGSVDSGNLYLATAAADNAKGNEIVAFDLGTGKVKWRTPAGEKRTLLPLQAADGKLIAYREAEEEQGGEVLSIPAAGGEPTVLLRHPSGPAAPIESSFYAPQGRLRGRPVLHLRLPAARPRQGREAPDGLRQVNESTESPTRGSSTR
ncbi:hypothetical protein GCM10020254_50460 [Streptomyces goshikiensis]